MFTESAIHTSETGWIEVVCGSMFSGKTEELMRRMKRAQIARLDIEIFKPQTDTRYSEEEVVSHDQNSIQATVVSSSQEILLYASNAQVIGIDEAQFFDNGIVDVVNTLANQGKRIVIAGLDMDFQGKPFGPMPYLLAVAEYVTKVHAICVKTGGLAHYSHRISDGGENTILLGEKEHYEPVSRTVFKNLKKTV